MVLKTGYSLKCTCSISKCAKSLIEVLFAFILSMFINEINIALCRCGSQNDTFAKGVNVLIKWTNEVLLVRERVKG